MATSGQIQPLKIPDAVVALAQAAAKANGDTEKYLPGWPLFSPPKMQLTKCGKCPREFCSSIALRRHSRVHRRALKLDKDFFKNRDHLAAFWDKLTVDQAQAVLSLEGVAIEETTALSILTALSSWMCKPGYASLPLTYARAGNQLLDLIQTAPSRLPMSSNQLFAMLDEASENTCLCTNAADAACSVQKFLFDGEVEKVATELKNVVACTSYILEQKLVYDCVSIILEQKLFGSKHGPLTRLLKRYDARSFSWRKRMLHRKDLPGWPLFSPPKMQLTKCAKCPREFCSSIALRRHSRVHRRALNIDKDFFKNRDHLAAFWDKLTVDQAKEILSLENVAIEETTALSILTALSSWMCKPGYASLPLTYARAGNELLDLIQTAASRLPISSNVLFAMLDEASENTCLCTNAADAACSVQKFLFDGEVEKVATELKNVVACTSYILERKLVEAWSADKAAEALRCQKLLVEEEDAAQKRQAEIMERKRLKKLRQKEQRLKYLKDEDVMVQLPQVLDGATGPPGIQSPEAISGLCEQEDPEYLRLAAPTPPSEDNGPIGEDATCDSVHGMDTNVVSREQAMSTSNLDRLENLPQSSSVSSSMVPTKHPSSARHPRQRDPNASATVSNRSKTWAWKVRADVEEGCPKAAELAVDGGHDETAVDTDKSSELLIGSISLAIEDGGGKRLQGSQPSKDDPTPESHPNHHTVAKVMQPISHGGNGSEDTDGGASEDHSPSSVVTEDRVSPSYCDGEQAAGGDSRGDASVFCSKEASIFLSQRWKEAMAGDHVKLVLCSDN